MQKGNIMDTCGLSMKAERITSSTQIVFPRSRFRRACKRRSGQLPRKSQKVEDLFGAMFERCLCVVFSGDGLTGKESAGRLR